MADSTGRERREATSESPILGLGTRIEIGPTLIKVVYTTNQIQSLWLSSWVPTLVQSFRTVCVLSS